MPVVGDHVAGLDRDGTDREGLHLSRGDGRIRHERVPLSNTTLYSLAVPVGRST